MGQSGKLGKDKKQENEVEKFWNNWCRKINLQQRNDKLTENRNQSLSIPGQA